MSDVSAMSLALLRRVAEFLDDLPADQVADLAEGRALLAYVPLGATEPVAAPGVRKAASKRASAPKSNPVEDTEG